jgi:hypothetical protein
MWSPPLWFNGLSGDEMEKRSRVNGRNAVYAPNHPGANNTGYVLNARLVVERAIGRLLTSDECVHHKNDDKLDDALTNLEVKTRSRHTKDHWASGELHRKYDYTQIKSLMDQGFGCKRIAKMLEAPVSTVKSACRVIRREQNLMGSTLVSTGS